MRSEVRRLHLLDLEQVRHRHAGQEWAPHWHDAWSFGAIVAGRCRCSVGGRPFEGTPGDLVAIAPGTVHTGALHAGDPRHGVLVVMFYVPAVWLDHRRLPVPARSGRVHRPGIARAAAALQDADAAQAWLLRAIPALARGLHDEPASPDERPTPATRTLLARLRRAVLDGEHTVSGMARRCDVSREHLHRVVTRTLGMTPRDYLRTVRLHRARLRVLDGAPIATVAAECGFADQAHFTRWFRRAFGYTPGDLAGAVAPSAAGRHAPVRHRAGDA